MKICKDSISASLLLAGLAFGHSSFASNDAATMMPDISNKNILVGFWLDTHDKKDGYKQGTQVKVPLSSVPSEYNVVTVAFMTGEGIPTFKPLTMDDATFRAEVGKLNERGTAVILSLGGAENHIQLKQGDARAFANEIIRLVELYGFDGLDIDLEQNAITAGSNQTEIPAALKLVKEKYPKFIISMAPEFPYLKPHGAYAPLIKSLEGYYDFISPQYYNQAGDGIWDPSIPTSCNGGTPNCITQGDDVQKADFLYYLSDSLIHGTRGYIKIPANKLVIGLPSNPDAAANGYVRNEIDVRTALNRLAAQDTPIKGLMTWSINWEAGRDKNDNDYSWEFKRRYASMIHDGDSTVDDIAPTQPGKPIVKILSKQVVLSWAASQDNVGVTQYIVYRNNNKLAETASPQYNDGVVQPDTSYAYYVIAVDKYGNRSTPSEVVSVTTDKDEIPGQQKPDTPSGLKASSVGESSLTISWGKVEKAVKYRVTRNGSTPVVVKNTEFTDSNLKPGTTYSYIVIAENAEGRPSDPSKALEVTTHDSAITPEGDWQIGQNYKVGDKVTYQGKKYRCLQGHPALSHWTPDATLSLWEPIN
uniref:carbohydrate-binding protein n=1 Tax=Scandinavium goeteborgense TaxID=1851514 RepID=UPI00135C296F|nr:glycosyl hydrolase family 18 protein [Scandinavium goeteborgense]